MGKRRKGKNKDDNIYILLHRVRSQVQLRADEPKLPLEELEIVTVSVRTLEQGNHCADQTLYSYGAW